MSKLVEKTEKTEKTENIKPKYFACYLDNFALVKHLSDEAAGRVWKMLFALAIDGEYGDADDPMVAMAFDMMAQKLLRDFNAYARKVEINRKNGQKGGAPKGNQNARKKKTTQTTETTQYKYEDEDEDKYKDEYEDENEDEDEYEEEEEYEEEYKPYALHRDSADSSASSASSVLSLFDSVCISLPKAGGLTENRKLQIARAESALGGVRWEEYFRRVEASDFLSGRNGKWQGCTLDWLLRADTIAKVLGGQYDNRRPSPAPAQPSYYGLDYPSTVSSYDINELDKIDTLDFVELD